MDRGHFQVLDGLRGLAAIAVVAYHFAGRADLPYVVPRGYLAVDFFFVLSGLVVSHAYLRPLQAELSAGRFVLMRAIRLWPMLLAGTLLGAMLELGRPGGDAPIHHLAGFAGVTLLGCLALPWPVPTGGEQVIFPMDGPVWSLFFEILANLAFLAIATRAWWRPGAWSLAATGAVGLVVCAFLFGTADIGFRFGDWEGGLPRVAFSFFAGVLLDRSLRYFPPINAALFPAALIAVFSLPLVQGWGDPAIDLVAILVVFPLTIGLASRATAGRTARLCDVAGRLSYPLYALHYPVIRVICFVMNRHGAATPLRLAIGAGSIVLLLGLSWVVLVWYDQPLRDALRRHLLPRRAALPAFPEGGVSWSSPIELERNA